MKNLLVILWATMVVWCNLTLAKSTAYHEMEWPVLDSSNSESRQMLFNEANIPHYRVSRSLSKILDAKKSLLLKGKKKIKAAAECFSSADTGEFITTEITETIMNGFAAKEKSSLDMLLRNKTGPLTLPELLADLTKDDSELNTPAGVQLTNKAIVEAMLSSNVLLRFPLTDNNGIVIDNHRALAIAFNTGRLKFPVTDRVGGILSDLSDVLAVGTKEVLGTLLGGNVVSDILESGALHLLNYPIKDAWGIPIMDVDSLLFLMIEGGFKNLKFPLFNTFSLQLRDATDLLLILLDGGFLKNLVYPLRDSNGLVIQNKQTILKFLREGLAFNSLKYPISDSFGVTIKRPDALMAALLDDNVARSVGFPLTDTQGAVLKDKLQLFLTLLDGGLNLVTFPLKDAEGNFFKDKMAFLIAIVKALRDKQGLVGFLQRSATAIIKFPLTDNAGTMITDKTELLNVLLENQTLSGLKFPFSDHERQTIPNKETFLLNLLDNGLESLEFPLTNRDGITFYKGLDLVDTLIDGSALRGLKFPLRDKRGSTIKDKEQLLQHIFKNDLKYPLTDCATNEITDLCELIQLLLDVDGLESLEFPLFDGKGEIFKNKADFLAALLKGGLEALNFPLKDANGDVLKDLENLLETLLNNSILAKLVLPLTDVTGMVFNNKLDFLDSLLGGVLDLPTVNLTHILGGVIKDVDTLLESLLDGVKLLNFPLIDNSGHTLNNAPDVLEDMLKGSAGLKAIKFPLYDKSGHVLMNKQTLLNILSNDKALNWLKFPLIDEAGTIFKNKNDFLRRLLKGLTTLNFPLIDGAGLNLSNGISLLEVLLQSVLALLKPVLDPLTHVLEPIPNIINGIFLTGGGNLTITEALLRNNANTSSALKYPLSDASARNITNQLELFEYVLNSGLTALKFPLNDSRGQVITDQKQFLQQILDNGASANLQFPLKQNEGRVLANEQTLLTFIVNNKLQPHDFPMIAANGLTINNKLELLIKVLDNQALTRLIFPLYNKTGNAIISAQALQQLLIDSGLASFNYPIFDADHKIIADKEMLAEILGDSFMSNNLTYQRTHKTSPTDVLKDMTKILADESFLLGDHLALYKAIKNGSVRERDLRDLLGDQKLSVLKEKLAKADQANALDRLQLTKIFDALLNLLLKKKPKLLASLKENSNKDTFT